MLRNSSKLLGLLFLVLVLVLAVAACGNNEIDPVEEAGAGETAQQQQQPAEADTGQEPEPVERGDVTVVRIGHNWIREMDINFRDPITGEPGMGQEVLNARIFAEQRVLELHNAVIEWVQYPSVIQEDLLRTVLAGAPIADLVRIVGGQHGTLLAQNVLQPLDGFAHMFDGEDYEWMLPGQVFGSYFFINNVLRYGNNAPLAYNITMIQEVDALRGPDGRVMLPSDHWREGTWTWSVFEEMLRAISDHHQQTWEGISGFNAHIPVATLMAIHSNGGYLYGPSGFRGDSPEVLEAVAWMERMMAQDLIRNWDMIPGTSRWGGLMEVWRFQWGHTVFANLQQWLAGDMVNQFNDRGHTMGVVPFPRPDHIPLGDPRYRQLNDAHDAYGLPRGIPADHAELAIRVFRDYTAYFYRAMANSERVLDYLQADGSARAAAMRMFIDITHPDYGQDLLDIWKFLGSDENARTNEFALHVGILDFWSFDILGNSLFGIGGAPGYATHLAASMGQLNNIMDTIRNSIGGDAFVNNIPPRFIDEGHRLIYPINTDPSAIDFRSYLSAYHPLEGDLDMANAVIDYSGVPFDLAGVHSNAVVFSISDSDGNVGTRAMNITLFDPDNTEPPSMQLHGDLPEIDLDTNVSDINWLGQFVWYANDADGIDIRDSLFVDVSELDTTSPGEYWVSFTVTDFAGNSTTIETYVTVVWDN